MEIGENLKEVITVVVCAITALGMFYLMLKDRD